MSAHEITLIVVIVIVTVVLLSLLLIVEVLLPAFTVSVGVVDVLLQCRQAKLRHHIMIVIEICMLGSLLSFCGHVAASQSWWPIFGLANRIACTKNAKAIVGTAVGALASR